MSRGRPRQVMARVRHVGPIRVGATGICPNCGAFHAIRQQISTSPTRPSEEPATEMEPGDLAMCGGCATPLKLQEDLTFRLLTVREAIELATTIAAAKEWVRSVAGAIFGSSHEHKPDDSRPN